MVGKRTYRDSLVSGQSARLVAGYIYATAGEGESTTDLVFGGQNIIAENGTILAEATSLHGTSTEDATKLATIDVSKLATERRRMSTYPATQAERYRCV